jgi:hypothetical protein
MAAELRKVGHPSGSRRKKPTAPQAEAQRRTAPRRALLVREEGAPRRGKSLPSLLLSVRLMPGLADD